MALAAADRKDLLGEVDPPTYEDYPNSFLCYVLGGVVQGRDVATMAIEESNVLEALTGEVGTDGSNIIC